MIDPTTRILHDLTRLNEQPHQPDYTRRWQSRYLDLLIAQSRAAIAVEERRIAEYEAKQTALRDAAPDR